MTPADTVCSSNEPRLSLPMRHRYAIQAKQGRAVFAIDVRLVDKDGEALSWDGHVAGELQVRGPWVNSGHVGSEVASPLHDAWFPTGDVAMIDADGFMQIRERSKDAIKPDDEWINSIEIESVACLHPGVASAACIAATHPEWNERPLLLIVKTPGSALERDELLDFLDGRVAKRWKPDEIVFVDALPSGATGKVLKTRLKEAAEDYHLAD